MTGPPPLALGADWTETGRMRHTGAMPQPVRSRDVSVSLVAVPEISAAVFYGFQETLACVGTVWEQMTGEATDSRRMVPRIVGASTAQIRTALGGTLVPEHLFSDEHRSDVVIVADLAIMPAGEPRGRWPEAAEWLRDQHARGAIVCSVCTGSLLLAEAGLLDGLEATSHWGAREQFRRCYPRVLLRPERILVPAGQEHRLVTSGGPASWSDLALYLIARFCGEAEARRIAKVFLFGDRSAGQRPFAAMVRPKQHGDAVIAAGQAWIADSYACANPVAKMVERSGLLPRTFERRFKAATGYAPLDYVQTLRVEEAKQMLETGETAIDDIAVAVGYVEPNSFRRLFRRVTGVAPNQYRLRFRTVGSRAGEAEGAGVEDAGLGRTVDGDDLVEKRGDVVDLLGDHVHHVAVALQAAGDLQAAAGDHRAAEAFEDLGPDHDVGDTGLVLERDEDHPLGGAGPLAADDDAGDCHPHAVRRQLELAGGQAPRRARPGWRCVVHWSRTGIPERRC